MSRDCQPHEKPNRSQTVVSQSQVWSSLTPSTQDQNPLTTCLLAKHLFCWQLPCLFWWAWRAQKPEFLRERSSIFIRHTEWTEERKPHETARTVTGVLHVVLSCMFVPVWTSSDKTTTPFDGMSSHQMLYNTLLQTYLWLHQTDLFCSIDGIVSLLAWLWTYCSANRQDSRDADMACRLRGYIFAKFNPLPNMASQQ